MTTIIRRNYHFVDNQNQINNIQTILDWLADKGFALVYYGRPESNNPHYRNLEFVAQSKKKITQKVVDEFAYLERYPWG